MPARTYLLLILALISVSSSSLVVRYVSSVSAITLAFWRMLTASGMLWAYSSLYKCEPLSTRNKKRVAFAGMFLGLHFIFFFIGVREVSIANATIFANTGPFFTSLIALLSGKPVHRNALIGLCSAVVGILIIQGADLQMGYKSTLGNLTSLLSGLCIAITYVFASKIREETENVVYGRSLFLAASLCIGMVGLLFGDSLFRFTTDHFFWFLFLGFVPTVLGHNILNYVIKYLTPTAVASVPLGEPIVASVLAFFLFSEMVSIGVFIGGPFIFFGIFLVLKNSLKP